MRSHLLLTLGALAAGCSEGPPATPTPAWLEQKTAVHVHSVHSHDACDGRPRVDGAPNAACAQDLRDGICATDYDHVFLTDHDVEMAGVPWGELLAPLYRAGDTWVGGEARQGLSMRCPSGHTAHVYPGAENDLMPVGLDRHVGQGLAVGDPALHQLYDKAGAENVAAFKAAGAVVFVNHAEEHTTEEIDGFGVDGIEIYNIHATLRDLLAGRADVGDISGFLRTEGEGPDPDLLFLALFKDNVVDLTHWSRLSHTRRLSGVAAHDVHRNALPGPMADGERLDSYRRVLSWYSNRVFVPADPGPTREAVRRALAKGRLYVAGDVVGDPAGFDAVARAAQGEVRMGDEGPWSAGMVLEVRLPPDPPEGAPIEVALVEMRADGEWSDLVKRDGAGRASLAFDLPGAGVYRVEVRLTPKHLRARLKGAVRLAEQPFVWVRTNPFHLR